MEDRNEPLGIGLVGCGRVSQQRHLPALQRLPDVRVVAVADIDRLRLAQVADQFGITQRYTEYQQLVNDPAVEAVAVCVPAHSHVDIALAALDAGKHLFVEKPMALSLDDCDRLMQRARQARGRTMVGFNLRWHRLLRRTRETIQQGALGSLKLVHVSITSRFGENEPEWMALRERGGGVFLELGVHCFDLWRFLLQTEVEEVCAMRQGGVWEDETATVSAHLANGVLATAVVSKGTGESNEVEIFGQDGRLVISNYRFDGFQVSPSWSYPGSLRARARSLAGLVRDAPQVVSTVRQGGDYVASYHAEWRHFVGCVQHDLTPECTLEDGRRALQIALAAIESATVGRAVTVSHAARTIVPLASQDQRRLAESAVGGAAQSAG